MKKVEKLNCRIEPLDGATLFSLLRQIQEHLMFLVYVLQKFWKYFHEILKLPRAPNIIFCGYIGHLKYYIGCLSSSSLPQHNLLKLFITYATELTWTENLLSDSPKVEALLQLSSGLASSSCFKSQQFIYKLWFTTNFTVLWNRAAAVIQW